MIKRIHARVLALQAELKANKGIVPDSWIPWLEEIKLLLKLAVEFSPDNINTIIEEIIAAINIAEKA